MVAFNNTGFEKSCVVNGSYQCCGVTQQDAAPSAWQDADGNTINENETLAADWSKLSKFLFFKKKFIVSYKDEKSIVASKGKDYIIGIKTNKYFLVGLGLKRDKKEQKALKDSCGRTSHSNGKVHLSYKGLKAIYENLWD